MIYLQHGGFHDCSVDVIVTSCAALSTVAPYSTWVNLHFWILFPLSFQLLINGYMFHVRLTLTLTVTPSMQSVNPMYGRRWDSRRRRWIRRRWTVWWPPPSSTRSTRSWAWNQPRRGFRCGWVCSETLPSTDWSALTRLSRLSLVRTKAKKSPPPR